MNSTISYTLRILLLVVIFALVFLLANCLQKYTLTASYETISQDQDEMERAFEQQEVILEDWEMTEFNDSSSSSLHLS